MNQLVFKNLNHSTLLLEWPDNINTATLAQINHIQTVLASQPGILECYPAYRSLAVHFDPNLTSQEEIITGTSSNTPQVSSMSSKKWSLPVCYDAGKDLHSFSSSKEMTIEEVIELHTNTTYTVYFYGFLPGFMYLGGLHKRLHHPRKPTPDRRITPGSVAIGGSQTGIYPIASPGGWHVIGRCPIPIFNRHNDPPCFISPGDQITFSPVSTSSFELLKNDIESGKFEINQLSNG